MTHSSPYSGTDTLIHLDAVEKRFARPGGGGDFVALDGIDLTIPQGSITGVIGRSGAGKSTLVRLVNGLEKPTAGRVMVDGQDVARMEGHALRTLRRRVGMIFQHFNLLSSRTAWQNVALPLEIAGMPRRQIREKVGPLLELVGLQGKAGNYPAELSGGQKQRVGIARALATDPKVLLSDEATSALDPETTGQVLALLKKVNRDLGLTVILITHEMQVVRQIAGRVAVIEEGRIVEEGDTYSVFSRPQHPTTRTFLEGVTGVRLPAFLAERIVSDPAEATETILKIVFTGPTATDPILHRIGHEMGVKVNIMAGAVDEIDEKPYGTLIVTHDSHREDEVRRYVAAQGLTTEVLGHVR